MPELAEVETFKRQLDPLLLNSKIRKFTVTHPRSIRRHNDLDELQRRILGHKIVATHRHGKYFAIEFETGDFLNIHLRMSGRFVASEKAKYSPSTNPKHSHVVIETDSHVFVFVDPRTFGELWLTTGITEEMKRGVDAFASTFAEREKVFQEIDGSKRPIKTILLDQNILSGIGNIYADEICASARIKPTRIFSSLTEGERKRINESCGKVLADAVALRGSSLRDESFRDLFGEIGQFQSQHAVHARKECANCGSEIIKVKVAGRSTYYCEKCQK